MPEVGYKIEGLERKQRLLDSLGFAPIEDDPCCSDVQEGKLSSGRGRSALVGAASPRTWKGRLLIGLWEPVQSNQVEFPFVPQLYSMRGKPCSSVIRGQVIWLPKFRDANGNSSSRAQMREGMRASLSDSESLKCVNV